MVKNPPAKAGDTGDTGSIPGSGRCPGGGHGNPLQYSCLENPMDRESWWATVRGAEQIGHEGSDSMHARSVSLQLDSVPFHYIGFLAVYLKNNLSFF